MQASASFSKRLHRGLLISSLLLLLLLLLITFIVVVLLDHDQVVVAIRRYHHVVVSTRDTQERQIILRVQVTHKRASSYGQLTEANRVVGRFLVFTHGRTYDLRLVSLLHLCFLHDDQTFDALVGRNTCNSLLDLALYPHTHSIN